MQSFYDLFYDRRTVCAAENKDLFYKVRADDLKKILLKATESKYLEKKIIMAKAKNM